MGLIKFYKTQHPKTKKYNFFSVFKNEHKTCLNTCKRTDYQQQWKQQRVPKFRKVRQLTTDWKLCQDRNQAGNLEVFRIERK